MAADQRYCLQCGKRRGEPRLPFMDAVTFMTAMGQPRTATASEVAAAPPKRQRPSANATLIAGVGILLLALGIGVMIGQSNDQGAAPVANATPQVIKVGGGEEAAASTAADSGTEIGGGKGGKAKRAKAAPEKAIDSSGTSEAAAKVLKPAGDVKLPPPTVQKGGKCESGAAGCEGGEFTGDFFGE